MELNLISDAFGILSLVTLEIILGIDNIIFIAVITNKLEQEKREKARIIGLVLALFIRILMLASISWIISFKEPLFTIYGADLSLRDLILIIGGMFLIFKSTVELHNKIDNNVSHNKSDKIKNKEKFIGVIAQIIVIDIIFSIDSVITAIGMAESLRVMIFAVITAMILMIFISKTISDFIHSHPTLIILCLSFLIMIGFSLILEGLGIHIPKAYMYFAICFSLFVELLNHINRKRNSKSDNNFKN